uniref:S5 DRBM domain-containing protein n=1 Tax=Amphora coffeiformis TaxID=265554 RepID=A0A7S3PAC5_9STRA
MMMMFQISRRVAQLSRGGSSAIPTGAATYAGDLVSRSFSSGSSRGNSGKSSFRPRRKPSRNYRPVKPGGVKKKDWAPGNDHKFVTVGKVENPKDELEAQFGRLGAAGIKDLRYEALRPEEHTIEDEIRLADYMTAEAGTTEEMAFERRFLYRETPEGRAKFLADIEEAIREGEKISMNFDDDTMRTYKKNPLADKNEFDQLLGEDGEDDEDDDGEDDDRENRIDPNQLAHGEWSELLIGVDRSIKLWRGGRLESYRALMIGGNCNGCGGFGIGKSSDPIKAVDLAGRKAKRNIFFVDRYQNNGLTSHLSGKMNSTKVIIRATDNGLRGNELCMEILMRFGITNAVCKAHGNRHPWNVVRATFKALMTHQSIEEISLKRGKRLVSLDRAMRMRI